MSIHITTEPIQDYVNLYSEPEQHVLQSLVLETNALVPGAQMLTGHLVGTFLRMMSRVMRPQVVVELGTYTGYSAICLAQGMPPQGHLYTIDIDDKWNEMRKVYWEKAGVNDRISQIIGNGIEVFANLDVKPDLVFIDADKKGYWDYFNIALDKMQQGGVILVDNVLFHGEIILPEEQQSNAAKYIHQFNIRATADPRVEKVMIPMRDGLSMFIKK